MIDPRQFSYRYLLPSVAPAAALVGLALAAALGGDRAASRAAAAAVAAIVACGAWSAIEFRRVSPLGYDGQGPRETVAGMRDLLAFLEHERIRNVYCADPMLQWTITFMSGERVVARWVDPVDRYPDYPRRVDCALARHERVALVGRTAQLRPEARRTVAIFGDEFFAIPDVSAAELAGTGFRLDPCRSVRGPGAPGRSP